VNRREEKVGFPLIPTFVAPPKISQLTLLKKRNSAKLYAALLHTHVSQPVVSESYSHQTSELVKLGLNNHALAGAFHISFGVLWILCLDFAGTQTEVLSFDLVLWQDQKWQ